MNSQNLQFNKNSQLKRKKRTKLFLLSLLVSIVVIGIVIGILRKPFLHINQVTLSGIETLTSEKVQREIDNYLSRMKWYVIPQKNILLFSKKDFSHWIKETFPSIKDAQIRFDQERNMTITIIERKPEMLWCQASSCFFIGFDGIIYQQAPQISDGVFLKIQGPVLENPLGYQINNQYRIQDILNVVESLESLGVTVSQITLDIPYKIFFYTLDGYSTLFSSHIKLDKDFDHQKILQSMQLLLDDDFFKDLLMKKSRNLDFIDLTIDGKIYYRFDSPVLEPVSLITSTPNE